MFQLWIIAKGIAWSMLCSLCRSYVLRHYNPYSSCCSLWRRLVSAHAIYCSGYVRAQTFDEYKPNHSEVLAERLVSVSETENVIECLLLVQIDTILLSCNVEREPSGIINACTNLMMHYDLFRPYVTSYMPTGVLVNSTVTWNFYMNCTCASRTYAGSVLFPSIQQTKSRSWNWSCTMHTSHGHHQPQCRVERINPYGRQ